jgi:hypothetical protein
LKYLKIINGIHIDDLKESFNSDINVNWIEKDKYNLNEEL